MGTPKEASIRRLKRDYTKSIYITMEGNCIYRYPYKKNIFKSKDAILLAAMCFQTYQLFEKGKLILPKGFELRYTIRAFANVEKPTEEVFGFIAESQYQIIIAF